MLRKVTLSSASKYLTLASTLLITFPGDLRAEQARAATAAPASGPCSKTAMEKALKTLTNERFFKLVGVEPSDGGFSEPWVFGTIAGRFLDPSCHVGLVSFGEMAPNATFASEAVFLAIEGQKLVVTKRISYEGVEQVGDCGAEIDQVADFDHDGRDELLLMERVVNTGDPEDPGGGRTFNFLSFRGGKVSILWQTAYAGLRTYDECSVSERRPCRREDVRIVFEDVDHDGTDELVVVRESGRYTGKRGTTVVGRPSVSRVVHRFDGKTFVETRLGATTPEPAKVAPAAPLSPPAGAVARFRARLSAQDHVNHQTGAALPFADQVIRQDRVRFHALKSPDPEDTPDPLYQKAGPRGELGVLVKKALSPADAARIVKSTPLVEVTVWPDRAEVSILSD